MLESNQGGQLDLSTLIRCLEVLEREHLAFCL